MKLLDTASLDAVTTTDITPFSFALMLVVTIEMGMIPTERWEPL